MRDSFKSAFVLAVAALLVGSTVGSVAMAGGLGQSSEDSVQPADEIYVQENGDAMLVYRDDQSSSTTTGQYGIDVSEGLLHAFVQDNSSTDSNVTGNASFVMGPESLSGEGDFQMPTPDSVSDLTVDASLTQTKKDAKASASVDATFQSESGTVGQGTSMLESVSTQGTFTSTASSFATDGSVTATFEQAPASMANQHHEFTLEETNAGYTLSMAQNYEVGSFGKSSWETREAARQSLEAQFSMIGQQLGGDVSVNIKSHSFDSATNRLDIEYVVEFSGVDEMLSEQIAQSLASSQQMDLSQSEAEDLAQRIQKLEVTKVSATLDVTDTEATASWDVQLDEYDEAAKAMLDIAEATEMQDDEAITQARKMFEAQQAAELEQTATWNGELTSPDANSARITFDGSYETENWGAYISELESRGIDDMGETTAEFHAKTENGELQTSFEAEVAQEDMIREAIDGMLSSAQGTTGASEDSQARKVLDAFKKSNFEKARMDVSVQKDSVTFEAGASFDNLSAFSDVLKDEYGGMNVASAYGEVEDGESVTYVRLKGATGENPAESDVRALAAVDAETTVHLPGDWSQEEQDFPEMDASEVKGYLQTDEDDGGFLGGMPGFGVGVALVALVGVSLVALRRD
ncbi:PGF-CTERM sorting domain-containing protein [Haloarchaeobius sp. DFWS5]|uniref:PGF-CTERM sorting domain-containing protein n=1 Tax=Haloarchaeobius sp. DFWS5 TaxID=3446114 RepID=UPI003EB7FE77